MAEEDKVLELQENRAPDSPPQPRRMGGWADEGHGREKGKRRRDVVEEDCSVTEWQDINHSERLKVHEDSDDDVPIIPDLEDVQEEELTTQVAAPPSVAVNRVTTYKQLDSDLHKHAGLFTLDGNIDLKILAKVLSPESEVTEEDKQWEWNKLFAELSPDIQETWDRLRGSESTSPDVPSVSEKLP